MKFASALLLGATVAIAAPAMRRSDGQVNIVEGDNTTTNTGMGGGAGQVDADDITVVDGDNNVVNSNAGDDIIVIEGDNNTSHANLGDDNTLIDGNNNTAYGGEGDDNILATGDGNTIYGGNGDDNILVDGTNTVVNAGAGDDNVVTTEGDDVINAGEGNDVVHAGAGDDSVVDSAGNDVYHGQAGDDTFVDGAGNDTYRGGKGNDTYKFDLTADSGRMNRVFHFQHNEAPYLDAIHLLNVEPSDIEFSHKIIEKCRTDMKYTDPVTGKKRTVRVHSKFGCVGAEDITWDAGVTVPTALAHFTKIENTSCGASGQYAYINYNNPLANEAVHYPGGVVSKLNTNPLRWHQGPNEYQTALECAEMCNNAPECVAFNLIRTGDHSNGFDNVLGSADEGAATCYFRSNVDSSGSSAHRDCYRIVPEIFKLQQNSITECVEDETYGFTNNYQNFYVTDGCRGIFSFGDDPTPVAASSWDFMYAEVAYDTSATNRF